MILPDKARHFQWALEKTPSMFQIHIDPLGTGSSVLLGHHCCPHSPSKRCPSSRKDGSYQSSQITAIGGGYRSRQAVQDEGFRRLCVGLLLYFCGEVN